MSKGSAPGGVLIGYERNMKKCGCNNEDTHALIVGATRCGKTRCNVLPTIALQAMAGESIIAVDPKGELYGYTKEFLAYLGYEVIAIDFKDPSSRAGHTYLPKIHAHWRDSAA